MFRRSTGCNGGYPSSMGFTDGYPSSMGFTDGYSYSSPAGLGHNERRSSA